MVYFDYPFVRLPRALNSEPVFLNLSVEARYLLTMLLDRLELSYNNADKFTDEEGKVYAICTIEEICEKFNCSSTKTLRMLKELECNGFIIRKRENRTVPCRIYITDLTFEFINCKLTTSQNQDSTSDFTKCKPASLQNQDSRVHENESRDFTKCEDIYTYNSNNNTINTNSSIIVTDDEIKEQIEFECIYCEKNAAMVDEIIMIISDIYNGRTPMVKIGKEELPRSDRGRDNINCSSEFRFTKPTSLTRGGKRLLCNFISFTPENANKKPRIRRYGAKCRLIQINKQILCMCLMPLQSLCL